MMGVQGADPSSNLRIDPRWGVVSCLAAIVGVLMLIEAALLLNSAKIHRPAWNEVGHLDAAASCEQLGLFDLCSVGSPLIRTIAAAPVPLIAKPEFDRGFYRPAASPGASGQVHFEIYIQPIAEAPAR
jgi:hypothetical protein